ncbi:MAG: bifunctional diguanylate cyclase/phosphodiesterase [Pseudomonadota bacterium]
MSFPPAGAFERMRSALRNFLLGPQLLAFLPALTLASFWLGGEDALVAIALILPIFFALAGLFTKGEADDLGPRDAVTNLPSRSYLVSKTDRILAEGPSRGQTTAALAVELDEFSDLEKRLGRRACDAILALTAQRLRGELRSEDLLARLDGPRFAIVMVAGQRTDLETLIQLSTRIQRAAEAPCSIEGARIFVTVSIGFCTPHRMPAKNGEALVEAAEHALIDAALTGAASIRAYTDEMKTRARARGALIDELPTALESDHFRPWFQPQVHTSTGEISGLEVLCRWQHPERGVIPPGEFLPAAENLGLMERLGEVMLYHSCNALRAWDAAGMHIPKVSVNFSAEELRNPRIVDKIRWELDRFDLSPSRLTVEVLETVIAQTASDTIIRNLRAFAELGCSVDLDDFGTGHASIANIKRFSVGRIKIDRSFVTRVDSDLDQQNIVSAILTLAERLELDTLAEGVETAAEHAVLGQLGCGHIQGFGIARPMPFEKLEGWLAEYEAARAEGHGPMAASAAVVPQRDAINQGKTA